MRRSMSNNSSRENPAARERASRCLRVKLVRPKYTVCSRENARALSGAKPAASAT